MRQIKRIIVLTFLIIMVGFGAAVSLKAAIGVGAWDAMAQSFSFLTGFKVGTLGILFNSSCVLGQFLILKKNFKWSQLLQVPVSILLGTMVNFFLYDVLGPLTINHYHINLLLLLAATVFLALVVGAVMTLDVVTFALEGFCMALSQVTGIGFAKIRQAADILSIAVILILTFSFSLPPSLREGTIISMLFFAPLMGFFMGKLRPLFQRFNLLATEPVKAAPQEDEQVEII